MKQGHHHMLLIFAVTVTLIVESSYAYMIYSVNSMTTGAVQAKSTSLSLQSGNSRDQKIEELSTKRSQDWNRLENSFVPVNNAVPFIDALEAIGPSTGSTVSISTIDNIDPNKTRPATNGYIKATVTADGSWSSVLRVLILAENMSYKTEIDNVNLQTYSSAEKNKRAWTGTFDVTVAKSI